MTTTDAQRTAHDLITQATTILEPVRVDDDNDPRLRMLYAISESWDEPCDSEEWESVIPQAHRRWNAASDLLEHRNSKGLIARINRRVLQIVDQAADLICHAPTETLSEHDRVVAAQLREAADDLATVVRALTAVPLLGEVGA